LKAVNAKTKFVEAGKRKIAYSSIGKGLPMTEDKYTIFDAL
jgi:hypothetical protein